MRVWINPRSKPSEFRTRRVQQKSLTCPRCSKIIPVSEPLSTHKCARRCIDDPYRTGRCRFCNTATAEQPLVCKSQKQGKNAVLDATLALHLTKAERDAPQLRAFPPFYRNAYCDIVKEIEESCKDLESKKGKPSPPFLPVVARSKVDSFTFSIAQTANGFGLFAAQIIPEGTDILAYTGPSLSDLTSEEKANPGLMRLKYDLGPPSARQRVGREAHTVIGCTVAAFINHACGTAANVSSTVDGDLGLNFAVIRTEKQIEVGDEILLDYLGANSKKLTPAKREELLGFKCACCSCVPPSKD